MTQSEVEFSLQSEMTANLDEILDAHRLFIRRARDRAKQMLFFFGLCRPTQDESVNATIRDYRAFAIGKLSELTQEVTGFEALRDEMDKVLQEYTLVLNPDVKITLSEWLQQPEQFGIWLEQTRERRDEQGLKWNINWRSSESDLVRVWHCREELERWRSICGIADLLKPDVKSESDPDWRSAQQQVEDFLKFEGTTSPLHALARTRDRHPTWLWRFVQWLRNVPLWVNKHLALLLMLTLGTSVIIQVEAVSSLIRNMGLLATILFGLALIPLILTDGVRWLRYRHREDVPTWDIGGVPHRSLLARAPRRFFQRWPNRSTRGRATQPQNASDEEGVEETTKAPQVVDKNPRNMFWLIVRGRLYRLGYLGLWIVAALLLWGLVASDTLDSTYLTVFLIVIILYSLVLAGRMIDFWDYFESKSIRLHWLFYIAVGVFALLEGWGYPFFMVVFALWFLWFFWSYRRRPDRPLRRVLAVIFGILTPLIGLLWATSEQAVWRATEAASNWRSDISWPFPGNGPVLVMAASGGGSRAALYTALTLEKLEAMQVNCEGRAAKCRLSEQLQAISSVSGGSLANAGYVARRFAQTNGITVDKALSDWVSDDYVLPTLWGAINPFLSRGDSIERTWQGLSDLVRICPPLKQNRSRTSTHWGSGEMKLGDLCLTDLASAWKQALEKGSETNSDVKIPFPMPLFNTSTLDGHDLVITPLPKNLYLASDFAEEARDPKSNRYQSRNATWVFYRDGIYGLEDLLGESFNALLSTSVRASANFPFGFPLVRLETRRPLFLRPDWKSRCEEAHHWQTCDAETVYLTDGGALSNSGMWSMFRLLLNKQGDLRARGVLLIMVEASKMPEPGNPDKAYRNLQGTIGDQAPIGQYLHRTMLDMLQSVYGDSIAIMQIDLQPDRTSNIHTTWAFDPGTRKDLEEIFDNRWKEKEPALFAMWSYLQGGSRDGGRQETDRDFKLIDRARPPLD